MMEDDPNFNLIMTGEDLIEVRGWWGMTQAEFARKLGVAVGLVECWERNETPIPSTVPSALEAIGRHDVADALNTLSTSNRIRIT